MPVSNQAFLSFYSELTPALKKGIAAYLAQTSKEGASRAEQIAGLASCLGVTCGAIATTSLSLYCSTFGREKGEELGYGCIVDISEDLVKRGAAEGVNSDEDAIAMMLAYLSVSAVDAVDADPLAVKGPETIQ